MVRPDAAAVGQHDLLTAPGARHDVDGRGAVVDDVQGRRRGGDERLVEPLEVLGHDPARQEVVRGDLPPVTDAAGIPVPAVSEVMRPFVETEAVAGPGMVPLVRIGVHRQLPARVVHEQVVGLGDSVHPGTRRRRLHDMDADLRARVWSRRFPVTMRSNADRPHEPSPTTAISITSRADDRRAVPPTSNATPRSRRLLRLSGRASSAARNTSRPKVSEPKPKNAGALRGETSRYAAAGALRDT